jgi:DNA gyrase inhibitor GyrI
MTYRGKLQTEGGQITVWMAYAVPDSLGELLYMLFSRYKLSSAKSDSWLPTFERRVCSEYSKEVKEKIESQSIFKFTVHPIQINGYEYD